VQGCRRGNGPQAAAGVYISLACNILTAALLSICIKNHLNIIFDMKKDLGTRYKSQS
jgi:hypothetical protein